MQISFRSRFDKKKYTDGKNNEWRKIEIPQIGTKLWSFLLINLLATCISIEVVD